MGVAKGRPHLPAAAAALAVAEDQASSLVAHGVSAVLVEVVTTGVGVQRRSPNDGDHFLQVELLTLEVDHHRRRPFDLDCPVVLQGLGGNLRSQ